MTRLPLVAAALAAFFTTAPQTAQACSQETPCTVSDGAYYIARPDTAEDVPAVMFIHGFGGSGRGALNNSGMVDAFLAQGYAVIAPDGMPRGSGGGNSWSFHPDRTQQRDEVAFLATVRDDAIARHGLRAQDIILTGFSIGGSMTAYLACTTPEAFSAYAPTGGNFWRPHPTGCNGPVRMLHTHGWTDGTVPLEGRVLRGADSNDPDALIQGDIFHAMDIWRQTNGCFQLKADRFVTDGPFWRRAWDRCADGSALELALFPGGHIIPRGWADLVVDWYEGL